MSRPSISDHALLRFMERGGEMDVEALRARLEASLARAHTAARSVSTSDYIIKADGMLFVVRGERVTTVIADTSEHEAARALSHQPQ
ncbi:MAG: hypothetical protein ACOY45_05830 [Pseudomonadota bacterium]